MGPMSKTATNSQTRRFTTCLAMVLLHVAGLGCSSSTPLKKTSDGAVNQDLGVGDGLAGDASPGQAGPDLAVTDVFVQAAPDVPPVGKDGALADLFAPGDAVWSDLPVGKDAITLVDLPAIKDSSLADLPANPADAPTNDLPAGDVGVPRDGTADGFWGCKSDGGGAPGCNDNSIFSAVMGTCQPDGTCVCNSSYVINPSTGRCMYPLRDASAASDTAEAGTCTGDYTACGCGCCGGVQSASRCYYPSLGETIAAITAQDQAEKSATNCSLVGCSLGVHYVCCAEPAPESPSSATYVANGYSGGLDHIVIAKSGSDCATLSFARPMTGTSSALKITMPTNWVVLSSGFGSCGDAGAMDQANGGVGTLALHASGSDCLADLHATLFAFAADGTVRSSRFDIDGIVVTGMPGGLCK